MILLTDNKFIRCSKINFNNLVLMQMIHFEQIKYITVTNFTKNFEYTDNLILITTLSTETFKNNCSYTQHKYCIAITDVVF